MKPKIKVGQVWTTRGGHRVRILNVFTETGFPIVGKYLLPETAGREGGIDTWTAEGRLFPTKTSAADLVFLESDDVNAFADPRDAALALCRDALYGELAAWLRGASVLDGPGRPRLASLGDDEREIACRMAEALTAAEAVLGRKIAPEEAWLGPCIDELTTPEPEES